MRVIITGGTGLIGRRLVRLLNSEGSDVVVLSRDPAAHADGLPSGARAVRWDAKTPDGWGHLLDAGDVAIVNLAGENVGAGRWTAAHKQRVIQSRLDATDAVKTAIEQAEHKPDVLIQASAVGYYGNRNDAELVEDADPGEDWLAEVCKTWEAAAMDVPVRTAVCRIGVVLDRLGGALPAFLQAANLFGARLGSGDQWLPWIHHADVVHATRYLLHHPGAEGVFNISAPNPCRNEEFFETLTAVRGRPNLLPVPEMMLRLGLGEQANAILNSQRVLPDRLQQAGYRFRFPQLEPAVRDLLSEPTHWN